MHPIQNTTCIVRNTAAAHGRSRSVSPGQTAARHLHYGRIRLDATDPPLQFATGDLETGLVCLSGGAGVGVDGASYTLDRYDTLYVPRDSKVEVRPGAAGCDLAEIAAPVTRRHPVQFVSFKNVQGDAGLHFQAGGPSSKR